MFPLKERKIIGYKFGQKTSYSNFHLGVDYKANFVPLYAPFDGTITATLNGSEGGLTIWFHPDNDDVLVRFLHLSKILKHSGKVKAGEQIGITGNSGHSDFAHLHLDISKHSLQLNNISNFIDPEKYAWEKGNMAQIKTQSKGASRRIVIEAANENEWAVLTKVYGKDPNNLDEKV
jgi:murein DD-endopeptidase MepM/ murein hydrolase activator NlpD